MVKQSPETTDKRVIRFPEVKRRVGYSRMHVDRLEKAGKFPKRIQLGENTVAWVEREVDAWLDAKISARDMSGISSVAVVEAQVPA